jgi:hypothetical protein
MKPFMSAGMLMVLLALGVSQGKVELDALSDKISSHLESNLPGWKYQRIPPFGTPETKVIVHSWYTTNKSVMIQIAVRATEEDAKKEVRSFLEFRREPQELSGFGDEAYVLEPNQSHLILRRGRYVIYIHPNAENDPALQNLPAPERQAREKAEADEIGKEFAKLLAAIELPA